ncbi:MAG: hypothetical protein HYY09_06725 [Firmicutes bacterium]|nr:hypothetical protein [Bacillota bacterium]
MQQLADFFWLRLPRRIAGLLPAWRRIAVDGYFLQAWPTAAALSIPAAAMIGAMTAVLARLSFVGQGPIAATGLYSNYLWFLLLAMVAGTVSRHVGAWLLIGYAVPDLLLHLGERWLGLPRIFAYLLLAFPTVIVAERSSAAGGRLWQALAPGIRLKTAPHWISALVAAGFTYAWGTGFGAILTPAYTWAGRMLNFQAASVPAQNVWLLMLAAAVATVARSFLARRGPDLWAPPLPLSFRLDRWLPRRSWQRTAAEGLIGSLVLVGPMPGLPNFLFRAALFTGLGALGKGLIQVPVPAVAGGWLSKVPAGLQRPAVFVGGLLCAWLLLTATGRLLLKPAVILVMMMIVVAATEIAGTAAPATGKERASV